MQKGCATPRVIGKGKKSRFSLRKLSAPLLSAFAATALIFVGLSFVAVPFAAAAPHPISFISLGSTSFTAGTGGSFTVTTAVTNGTPAVTSITNAAFTGCTPTSLTGTGVALNYTSGLSATITSTISTASATYTLCLNASNGTSPNATQSFTLTVAQITPTISISNIPVSASYGGSFSPTYTVTSGDTGTTSITSNSTSVCTVNGLTVNYVGGGTCSLTAAIAATTDYAATSGTAQTFSIGQVDQSTLTLTSTSGTYGTDLMLTTSGGTDSGAVTYVVNDTGTAGCSVSDTTLSATSAGTCTVTATMAGNADYNPVSSLSTTVTIGLASSLATPSTPVIADLPASGTYEGSFRAIVNTTGDGTKSVTSSSKSVCTVKGLVVAYVGAGTCSLTAHVSQGTDYAAANGTAQTFTVRLPKPSIVVLTSLPARFPATGGTDKLVGVARFVTSWSITSPGLTETFHSTPFLDYTRCTATFHISANGSTQARVWKFTFTVSNSRGLASRTISVTEAGN